VSTGHELDTRLLRFRTRPGSEDAARLAGDLLIANRNADALEIAAVGLRASPEDLDLLLVEGRAELAGGDLLKAQAALLKAARVGSTRKEPYRYLGEVLMKRGDPARAAKVLERARGIDASDRAIQALHDRALRLAKIAESDHERASEESRSSFTPPVETKEERTMVRPDLSERLAAVTREKADEILGPKDGKRPAAPARAADPVLAEDDDEPTTIGPALSGRALAAPAPPPARAMPPPRAAPPKMAPLAVEPPPPIAPPPGALRPASALASAPSARGIDKSTSPGGFIAPARGGDGPKQAPSRRPPPLAEARAPKEDDSLEVPTFGGAAPLSEPFAPARPASLLDEEPRAVVYDASEADAPMSFASDEDGPPPESPPDEPTGELAGTSEDPDEVLEMLRREGIFEPPTGGDAAMWAPRKESRIERTTIGWVLALVWILCIGGAVGGWYGWQEYIRRRHAEAAHLVEQARAEARAGDHEDLVDAERHLREAREMDPHSTANPTVLLLVHSQRALEDGAFEIGYLAPTVIRAERTGGDPNYVHAANAIVAAGNGNAPAARTEIDAALAGAPDDAFILYIAGRLGQRLGDEHALEHLEAATQHDPELAAASIALAEARHDEGRPEDALTLLDAVLAHDAENLRAKLWRGFLTADDDEVEPALAVMTSLEPRLEHGAPTDHVLFDLTRSHLLRRQGHHDEAGAAVEAALSAGASEPRLLALVAQAARAENRFLQAEYAATEAVRGAPQNADFRKLLAGIYLDRRDGRHALQVLTQLSAEDPDVLEMTARAALLVGGDEALSTAAGAIDAYLESHESDAPVELRALRIRIAVAGNAEPAETLAAARTLAHDNPGDPVPALALGEAALRSHDARQALEALQTVVRTDPDDAEGHYLIGRAYRMNGDAENAEASFRHAIELSAEMVDAKVALASLLLDAGDYAGADALYVELGRLAGSASGASLSLTGRLGRVEALIGLGRLDDADVQLEQVRATERDTASAHLTSAHLAMAHAHYGDAVRELRPLAESETPSVIVLAAFGDALAGAGEDAAAGAAYDRALAIDSDSPEALLGKAELGIGDREAGGLLDRADHSLESRIRPPALHTRLKVLRARVAMAGHDNAAALLLLQQATTGEGVTPDAWFYYGEVLAAAHSADASAAYQHYVDLAPNGPHAAAARRGAR
jgi:tetratricopeptide (TPR) repeat protein